MLNVPQTFLNGFTGKTSSAYPIVIIKAGENIIRLSQIKGVFDGQYYEDRFLKVNSITEKIDIQNKKFKVNQVKVQVSNYIISQVRFSEKFKNFSFTNAEVDIYYANEACKALDDCLFIFKGFVKSYEGGKETVSFSIEDHSQYTLDLKRLPKHSTIDPDAETIEGSKDIYFPMVYGHVEKSPMIFSKGVNGTVFSQIYPEAIMFGIKIRGIKQVENPLVMFRDDMYLPVPEIFRPLPEPFYINGFDYSRYNETRQYDISQDRNWIQLEKKSSDFNSSYLLPLNVAARDQFQVDVSREVTGINADTSAGEGSDESGNYLNYGQAEGIRYLGRADGFEPYGENNYWTFPFPTGQFRAGYYQDFIFKGIIKKWDRYYRQAPNDYTDDIFYGTSSTSALFRYMAISNTTANGMRGFDLIYLPMPEGEGQTELIQYFNEDYISENDIVEINWKAEGTGNVPEGEGLWNGHTYAYWSSGEASTYLQGFPEASREWFHTQGGWGGPGYSREEWDKYLWGIELKNSVGEIVDVIGMDYTNTGVDGEGVDLTSIIKPQVYAWIVEMDANFEGEEIEFPGLTPDSVVNLRKLLWGRNITVSESTYAMNPPDETLNKRAIPLGTAMYGLYPRLGYMVPKNVSQNTYTQHPENGYYYSRYKRFHHYYELVCDTLYSYKNPYLLNQEDPMQGDDVYSMLHRLDKFDYSQLNTPNSQNRLNLYAHRSDNTYLRGNYANDGLFPIVFYGTQPSSVIERMQNTRYVSAGIDKVYGGNWCPINNIEGTKDLVKLDLTFQSLSGDDVVLGGVYSKIRGKVIVDLWKVASDQQYSGSSSEMPTLRVTCDALDPHENEIIRKDSVFNMPDAAIDENGEPDSYITLSTGSTEDGYNTAPNDPTIEFDADDPQYINTVCDAFEDEDEDQWRENINSINNISLFYDISQASGNNEPNVSTALYFKTNIQILTLDQRYVVGNASHQKYFANVEGRVDEPDGRYTGVPDPFEDQLLKHPADILMHIMEKELDYYNIDSFDQQSIEESRTNHAGWKFAFTITERTEAKKLIEDFSKSTKFIPRFRHNGTFGFINIFQNYNQADTVISASDVSGFKYSKTPISEVKLMVRVKYNYDYGTEKYSKATNLSNDGATPKNVEDMQEMYAINKLTDAYLEVESKYIRDSNTALLLRNYLLEWYKNQHNIIDCTLPPKYMYLECGDIVGFNSLIEEMTIFGEDYTEEYYIGGGDGSDHSQKALPYFIVSEVSKSQKNVKVKLLQIHKSDIMNINNNSPNYLTGDFYVPVEEFEPEDIEDVAEEGESDDVIMGDVNFDGSLDVLDIVGIVNVILNNAQFNEDQIIAGDVDLDGYITVLDIVLIVNSIVNDEPIGGGV